MGVLFISHSSADNERALYVRQWLNDHGWTQVFLDLDTEQGIVPGHRWQQELKQAGERCSGVVLLISSGWAASRWCQTEFLVADQLGKKIFPLLIAPTSWDGLPRELTGRFQFADISTKEKEEEGFQRLAIGLKRAGLDPQSFPWPPPCEPDRPIYRGLQSLEEVDAAIFFGRDALITKGMDALRRIRQGAPERIFVILGASGSGKSSFLKAGLVARLKRDEENFLVLPVVRPQRAAVSGRFGIAACLGCEPALLRDQKDVIAMLAERRVEALRSLQQFNVGWTEKNVLGAPTLIIPIDQAEEFFIPQNDEAAHALDILRESIHTDAKVILAATIRSDSFHKLQTEPRFSEIPILPFSLPPIPPGAFKEIIEGPARLANPSLTIEPELCDRLLEDLSAEDALPLLAFTLERLSARHPRGGKITLSEYTGEFGGLEGAITSAVDSAFAQAKRDPELPHTHTELERLARAAFIPALVQLDDTDAVPRRRIEPLNALPPPTQPLVRHLINQRLLVCNKNNVGDIAVDTVEVTHEAILRQWPALREWIAEERDTLRTLEAARNAASEWHVHSALKRLDQTRGWLVHKGGRLIEAEALLARPDYAPAINKTVREYLGACRLQEDADHLREQQAFLRTRRLQKTIGIVISIAAATVLVAALSILQLFVGLTSQASDTLGALAAKEASALNYDRAERYAVAALTGVGWGPRSRAAAVAELRGAVAESSASRVLRGHRDQVLSAAFDPDGSRIVTGSRDRTARIWAVANGRQIAVLKGHNGAVLSAAFSPDGTRIVTASEDKTARLWFGNASTARTVFTGHEEAVLTAAFSPDGTRVVTGSADGTARIWNPTSGRQLLVLRGHGDYVASATFSPDGRHVLTASGDGTAIMWNATTGTQELAFRGHTAAVESAAYSSDGKRIVTASNDKTARIWDAHTAREIAVLRGHVGSVNSAEFNMDGSCIVTASEDKTVRIWNANDAREIAILRGHDEQINAAAFSPNGARIVSASDDKTARIWIADASKHVTILLGHESPVLAGAFSPNGKQVITASSDKTIRLWNARTGQEIGNMHGHQAIVETVAFSPNGTRSVSASDDKTARIWDLATGREIAVLHGHSGPVYSAAFSADGARIVTASVDRTARIWNAITGDEINVLSGHGLGLNSAVFSPDGSRVLTASDDMTAMVWDAISRQRLLVLRGHTKSVISAAFSPDAKWILTASRDSTARIWDARTGLQSSILSGHSEGLMGAAYSPDGKRIVTVSRDETVRLWDARTKSEIMVLRGHEGGINGVAFSPDGNHVVTVSEDHSARVWDISSAVPISDDLLLSRVCSAMRGSGLSAFSASELRTAVPAIDPMINADACQPPGWWPRLSRTFLAGVSH